MQAAPSGRDKAGRTWGLLCHLQGRGCRIRRGWQAGGSGRCRARTCPRKWKADKEGACEHVFTAPGLQLQEAG